MGERRGRQDQVGRRDRRDRDRQGDHGGRGDRRGHARQDPGPRRHRRRRRQYADRGDPERRRGRLRDQGRGAGRKPRRRRPSRSRRSRPRPKPRRRPPTPPARRRRCRSPKAADRDRRPRGHRDGHHDRARGAARRHGGGDAPRRRRLRHRRGGRGIPGRLQGDPGAAAGIRRPPRHRHADHRARLYRPRRRRRACRPQADRRVHDLQLRHAGDRPDHQLRGQDALHVGRPARLLDRVPRPQRAGRARRRPAQPGLHAVVLERSRPHRGRALHRRRRQGPAQVGDPLPQSGGVPGERNPLRPFVPGAEARRLSGSARQGEDRARPASR